MKITAHFAPPVVQLVRPATLTLWALAIAMLAASAGLLYMGSTTARGEMSALRERLATTEARLAEATATAAFVPPAELVAVRDRVAAVNALAGVRGWPAPVMLARLETLLPSNAFLVSLVHKLRDGELHLVAESESVDALTAFLQKLEREPHFAEVMLVRQTQRGSREARGIQFEIRLKEKS